MAISDILLALSTYPDPTPESSVQDAVALAAAFGARMSAVACEVSIQLPRTVVPDLLINIPGMAAAEREKSAKNAAHLLAAVEREAKKQGVAYETVLEKCFTMEAPGVLVEYARLHDLTVVPIPADDNADRWYAETIIFGSGRPTLILPQAWKRPETSPFATAVVAWDFSRTAARAVADALPLLQKAKQVFVMTVENEKAIERGRSGAELAKHLARHGVEVVYDRVDAAGRRIGDVLEEHVAKRKADLLVMGAYGHSRLQQFILGGATRSILARPRLPVLMSH